MGDSVRDLPRHLAHERLPFEPELAHVPGGPFVMGTSDQQIDILAQQDELANL